MLGRLIATSQGGCKMSYFAAVPHRCWIIERVSNETNEDVRMYTCRIYSSRDLDTLLYKVELDNIGKMLVYIHSQQRIEKCENCS